MSHYVSIGGEEDGIARRSTLSVADIIQGQNEEAIQKDFDALHHIKEQIEKYPSGGAALLQKMRARDKTTPVEKKIAYRRLRAELDQVLVQMRKLYTVAGGTIAFFYVPSSQLKRPDADGNDLRMLAHTRFQTYSDEPEEVRYRYFPKGPFNEVIQSFTAAKNRNFAGESMAAVYPEPPNAPDDLPTAVAVEAPAQGEVMSDEFLLKDFEEYLPEGFFGNAEHVAAEIMRYLPTAAPIAAPIADPTAAPIADPTAAPTAPPVSKKRKRSSFVAPVEVLGKNLDNVEHDQVKKIMNLLGFDETDHVMCKSIPKPDWVIYGGTYKTETPYPFEPGNWRSTLRIQTQALKAFMIQGYWYNMGCRDLNNFFDWLESNMETKETQGAFKAKMSVCKPFSKGYFATNAYPILVRLFFNYTSSYTNMNEVNNAFRAYLQD
jgi:hypothetical protein